MYWYLPFLGLAEVEFLLWLLFQTGLNLREQHKRALNSSLGSKSENQLFLNWRDRNLASLVNPLDNCMHASKATYHIILAFKLLWYGKHKHKITGRGENSLWPFKHGLVKSTLEMSWHENIYSIWQTERNQINYSDIKYYCEQIGKFWNVWLEENNCGVNFCPLAS